MALDFCESCQSVEGGIRLATPMEIAEAFGVKELEVEDVWPDNYVCEACGSVGSIRGVREHDDGDER